jgi:hypothetical protein
MSKHVENFMPFILSIFVLVMLWVFKAYLLDLKLLINEVGKNSLQCSGVLLGFLLTIKTIIRSINNRATNTIRSIPEIEKRFTAFLDNSIICNVIVLLVAFCLSMIDGNKLYCYDKNIFNTIFFISSWFFLYSILISARFIYFFLKILREN